MTRLCRAKERYYAVVNVRRTYSTIPVTMAKGKHLFPSRTQQLSPSAPTVLGWTRPGRIGRCRLPKEKAIANAVAFSFGNLTNKTRT